jgi:hypothetical protein
MPSLQLRLFFHFGLALAGARRVYDGIFYIDRMEAATKLN